MLSTAIKTGTLPLNLLWVESPAGWVIVASLAFLRRVLPEAG